MIHSSFRRAALIGLSALALSLAGCGRRGPLVLPTAPDADATAAKTTPTQATPDAVDPFTTEDQRTADAARSTVQGDAPTPSLNVTPSAKKHTPFVLDPLL